MTKTISQNEFTKVLRYFFEETLESHRGIYLDPGTSLLETLDTISAETASIPVGGKCASLAAQVAHTTFYLENNEAFLLGHGDENADWEHIWKTVEKVTPEEWQQLKDNLRETYQRVKALCLARKDWGWEAIGNALGMMVHSAYHLGEIRQALCTLKS